MLFLQCQHATNLEPISYLLEKGLDPNISNSDGEYPLQQLIKRACDTSGGLNNGSGFYTEAIGLLIEHGAHLQYDLFQQGTAAAERIVMQPLQQAVVGRQVEIVDLLLDQESINVNAQASDGPDAWMTAASLGAGTGDVYLSKLLTHHVKTTQNGPLLLDTRLQSSGENFFHFIAHHEAAKLSAVPKIIRQICERCPTTEAMMRERDSSGFSPLMRLLDPKHERGVLSAKHEADPNMVQLMRDIDLRVTELFKLYLEFTSSRESYVRFMRADQVWKTTEILSDNTTSVFLDGKGDQSSAPVEIEYETVLHQLTKGKLMCEPKLSWMQWYGPNLVEILIDKRPEHFTKKGGTASLVDFVDLRTFRTALHFVVEKGDLQTAKLLLARFGADPNISPIRCAFCRASAINDAIEQAGGTPKASSADEACKGTCGTKELVRPALLEAVKKKMTTMVHSLLDHGARTDCVSATKRETPLHVALRLNNSRLVYDYSCMERVC
ncbi:RAC family serine/threonine-protein kinase [Phytophthora nicotianae]|uniref:RAC family serine/threonine-protein kinase n=1 Tax=Phytophthora nicotianae TaxID=4792 RepID=A0A0W8DH35_PHYNI|nr:RAC family serine/threonine-protein kinase [Phytophthora nicotianae]